MLVSLKSYRNFFSIIWNISRHTKSQMILPLTQPALIQRSWWSLTTHFFTLRYSCPSKFAASLWYPTPTKTTQLQQWKKSKSSWTRMHTRMGRHRGRVRYLVSENWREDSDSRHQECEEVQWYLFKEKAGLNVTMVTLLPNVETKWKSFSNPKMPKE